jgi:hypothetical protein
MGMNSDVNPRDRQCINNSATRTSKYSTRALNPKTCPAHDGSPPKRFLEAFLSSISSESRKYLHPDGVWNGGKLHTTRSTSSLYFETQAQRVGTSHERHIQQPNPPLSVLHHAAIRDDTGPCRRVLSSSQNPMLGRSCAQVDVG